LEIERRPFEERKMKDKEVYSAREIAELIRKAGQRSKPNGKVEGRDYWGIPT